MQLRSLTKAEQREGEIVQFGRQYYRITRINHKQQTVDLIQTFEPPSQVLEGGKE